MKVSDLVSKDFKTEYFIYEGVQNMIFTIRDNGNCRELWMEFSNRGFSMFVIGIQSSDTSFDFKQYVVDNIFDIFTEYVDMLRTLEDCNDV